MKQKLLAACVMALFMCLTAAAQSQEEFLDILTVKVKPEKRADFDRIVKKIVEVNRNNGGDRWIAGETFFGEQNTVFFASFRRNYAAVEQGYADFMAALTKGVGESAAMQLWQEFNNSILSSRAEVRRRRWDLSPNAPLDPAGRTRILGESRWLRIMIARVRPGRGADFETAAKMVKDAWEQAKTPGSNFVSQAVAGQQGTVYYVASLQSSMAGFDQSAPQLKDLLGAEAYQRFTKLWQDSVLASETTINRWVPELSNPPEDVVLTAPSFWRPQAVSSTTAP